MLTKEKIINIMETLDANDIVRMWNVYCENCKMYDDTIYNMSDFEEVEGNDFQQIFVKLADPSEFDLGCDYFWEDGLENIYSGDASFAVTEVVSLSDIAYDVVDNYSDYQGISSHLDNIFKEEEE